MDSSRLLPAADADVGLLPDAADVAHYGLLEGRLRRFGYSFRAPFVTGWRVPCRAQWVSEWNRPLLTRFSFCAARWSSAATPRARLRRTALRRCPPTRSGWQMAPRAPQPLLRGRGPPLREARWKRRTACRVARWRLSFGACRLGISSGRGRLPAVAATAALPPPDCGLVLCRWLQHSRTNAVWPAALDRNLPRPR